MKAYKRKVRSGGGVFKKRTETDLQYACLQLLELYVRQGVLIHADRLNSGNTVVLKRHVTKSGEAKEYISKRRGCQTGTPDSYAVTRNGTVIWIEYKMPGNTLTKEQREFRDKMLRAGHKYWVVYDAGDLETMLHSLL